MSIYLAVATILLLTQATAFIPSVSNTNAGKAAPKTSCNNPFSAPPVCPASVDTPRKRDVSVKEALSVLDGIVTGSIFLTAVAATILDQYPDLLPSKKVSSNEELDEDEEARVVATENEEKDDDKTEDVKDVTEEPDITAVKLEVASTIKGEKDKVDRLETAAKKKAAATETAEDIGGEDAGATVDEKTDEEEEKKIGLFRRIIKIAKKIVMPWKKFSDL